MTLEHKKFAANVAIDIAKLQVTLSSGFIVVTASVIGTFVDKTLLGYGLEIFWVAAVSWTLSIFSIASGILALGAIATTAHDDSGYDVDAIMTKWTMRVQQVTFVLAFVFFAVFSAVNAIDTVEASAVDEVSASG